MFLIPNFAPDYPAKRFTAWRFCSVFDPQMSVQSFIYPNTVAPCGALPSTRPPRCASVHGVTCGCVGSNLAIFFYLVFWDIKPFTKFYYLLFTNNNILCHITHHCRFTLNRGWLFFIFSLLSKILSSFFKKLTCILIPGNTIFFFFCCIVEILVCKDRISRWCFIITLSLF